MQRTIQQWTRTAALVAIAIGLTGCPNNIAGHEAGILETCDGVSKDVLQPGTHFYQPLCREVYVYHVGTQLFTMKGDGKAPAEGQAPVGDEACLKVKIKGGQEACLDIRTEYEIDRRHLPDLHKAVKDQYEQVILRPAVIRATKNRATVMTADAIYADETQVALEKHVEEELLKDDDLRRNGIIIHSFIIEGVHLDPKYEEEVKAKAIAQQTRLKEIELAAAAQETAKRTAAQAQAQVEQARANADAAKIGKVKEAEGQQEAAILEAKGIIAKGEAQARVEMLKREAMYAGAAGAWRGRIEIERARAEVIKGILAGVTVIPEHAVLQLTDGVTRPASVTPTVAVGGPPGR